MVVLDDLITDNELLLKLYDCTGAILPPDKTEEVFRIFKTLKI